ncbi:hypothetical protein LPJ61_004345, partial [Coemansia biformis]
MRPKARAKGDVGAKSGTPDSQAAANDAAMPYSEPQPLGALDARDYTDAHAFSTHKSKERQASEFISAYKSPFLERSGGSSRRHSSGSAKDALAASPTAPRCRGSTTPKRLGMNIPSRKLALLGVQIGRYVEQSGAHAIGRACGQLSVTIRYVQRVLEIGGLRGGSEYMKIDSSDIAAVEHMVCEDLAVLRITPVETIENIFEPDIFNPSGSSGPDLKDIFLCLRLPTKGDDSPILRLASVLQDDISVGLLDAKTFRRCAHELTMPPSIDLISSSDDDGGAGAGAADTLLGGRDATAAPPAAGLGYWGSIGEPRAGTTARNAGDRGSAPESHAFNSKRKSQTCLPGASASGVARGAGLHNYKLRKTKVGMAPSTMLPPGDGNDGGGDDDDDDFVVQCREFHCDDHTLRFEYPRGGPKPISVTGSDISRLYKGEFLNDTILEFYIRYIGENLRASNPLLHDQCLFFNTFFYRKLSQRSRSGAADPGSSPMSAVYQQLKKWTASVDLFDKRYMFVPINENTHWYLAIIVNTKAILPCSGGGGGSDCSREAAAGQSAQTAAADGAEEGPAAGPAGPGAKSSDGDGDVEMTDAASADPAAAGAGSASSSTTGNDSSASGRNSQTPGFSADVARTKNAAVAVDFMGERRAISAGSYRDPLSTPAIIIFDSLGNQHQPTFGLLRGYLRAEASWRLGVELPSEPQIGKYAK